MPTHREEWWVSLLSQLPPVHLAQSSSLGSGVIFLETGSPCLHQPEEDSPSLACPAPNLICTIPQSVSGGLAPKGFWKDSKLQVRTDHHQCVSQNNPHLMCVQRKGMKSDQVNVMWFVVCFSQLQSCIWQLYSRNSNCLPMDIYLEVWTQPW